MSKPVLDTSPTPDPEDSASLAALVRRAQARDQLAFEALYQRHKAFIWRRLYSLVGEKEDVNDLFQETFLRAWNGLPGTSADLQFGPWLKRIAANVAIDYLRHKVIIEFFPFEDDTHEEFQARLPQIVDPQICVSEKECIEQALAAMLPRYRMCVLLQDQWGFSQREIAQLLSITEKCVSSYICRGRIQVRQLYKQFSGIISRKWRRSINMSSDMQMLACPAWAEKLAALHPDDLTPAEQAELKLHLASCAGCTQVYQDYHYLAGLIQDCLPAATPPDLLPALPGFHKSAAEGAKIQHMFNSQSGVSSAAPLRMQRPRARKTLRNIVALIAAALIIVVTAGLLGISALRGQAGPGPVTPKGGGPVVKNTAGPVYHITPEAVSSVPPARSNPGGPAGLPSPTPAFFLNGNLYRNTSVYSADTGAFVRQYLKDLGDVEVYNPQLADGTLYMAVRPAPTQGIGAMVMYAVRPGDGAVLWKWSDCGQDVNMTPPLILNHTVYFACEAAPNQYKVYGLQAKTGAPLWSQTFTGQVNSLLGEQQTLYIQIDDQLLVENAATGKLLWKQSFNGGNFYPDQVVSGKGIIYIVQGTGFLALRSSDGAHLWEYQLDGDYNTPHLLLAPDMLYLFTSTKSGFADVYAIDSATGAMHWKRQLANNNSGFSMLDTRNLVLDHGNLYLLVNVFATPRTMSTPPLKRTILAIGGKDGQTLWQQDIPWNKGQLDYSMMATPQLSTGDGRIYLVDWQPFAGPAVRKASMGAFSENTGALLWTIEVG
ncbi:sigma-70 family RNA polymerase sigma factor [Dictyobacter kobayashii]|uniref:Sigma-70 family RNA polymerase sigma factor n=1 Tax=Dictyobacter kobayashii TaxID=2014872 RepID=A0A402AYN8_9CHLR|nr:sigma-70 family RNA polymerase sigma factor [Dictyobacter kobayashii]GCE24241.1 hypothetical protein KDK_80410 [Dictyobacter kobayashii]